MKSLNELLDRVFKRATLARMADREAVLISQVDLQHDRYVSLQHYLDDVQNQLAEVQGQLRDVIAKGASPVIRHIIWNLLHTPKLDVLCGMNANGCVTHFGEKDCSVAMMRSWVLGGDPPPQVAMLGTVMTDQPDSRAILAEAIDEWCDNREPASATNRDLRAKIRLGRCLAAAVRQDA